jgi:hypothetical protein
LCQGWPVEQPATTARRGSWTAVARWTLFGLIIAAFAWSVVHQWSGVRRDLERVEVRWIVLAACCGLASVSVSVQSWRCALAATGGSLPLRPSARVFYVGQLGKYLPGSVWPLLAQMELGRRYGLVRTQVAIGGLLQLGLSVLVTAVLGLAALPLAGSLPRWEIALVVSAVVLGVVVVVPPILDRLLRRGLRVLRRPPLSGPIGGREVLASTGWSIVAAAGLAGQAALLAHGLGADARGTLLAGGALLLATAIGVLAVPVPAGAGVREGALVLMMHGHLGATEATALALMSRLLLALADLAVAAVGAALGRGIAPPRGSGGDADTAMPRRRALPGKSVSEGSVGVD